MNYGLKNKVCYMETELRKGKVWSIFYNETTRRYIVCSQFERYEFGGKKRALDFFIENERKSKLY